MTHCYEDVVVDAGRLAVLIRHWACPGKVNGVVARDADRWIDDASRRQTPRDGTDRPRRAGIGGHGNCLLPTALRIRNIDSSVRGHLHVTMDHLTALWSVHSGSSEIDRHRLAE